MPLTEKHIMLIDILTDRLITTVTTMKTVKAMTEEEVDAEIKKWEDLSDSEMEKLDNH